VRKKYFLRGLLATGAIALSTAGVALPASAAPVTSAHSAVSAAPASAPGKLICSGDICVQRVTSISDNEAYVEVWAWKTGFTGHFQLYGPNGLIGNSSTTYWYAGGTGKLWRIPAGGGYTAYGWAGKSAPYTPMGSINFAV
jgi:hypothetical protein